MAQYAFITYWRFKADIETVWDALNDPEQWPAWWPYVARVEKLDPREEAGVGSLWRHTWKTSLPYSLSFDIRTTRLEAPHILEGEATGELEGTGKWFLMQDGEVTQVRYEWTVRTTKPWMRLLAPVARPLFAWNHHIVMREGGEGLARYLNTELVHDGP